MSDLQKSNAKYLWWNLLSLGFQPEIVAKPACARKHGITLGINMFDAPNKDAFYIVTLFLLEKLNPSRANEVFRHCWPVTGWKDDAEFRKATFNWFRDIGAERGNAFPKVAASLFISPGGPKFINVMLHLAKHVMLHEMKTFSGDQTWVPEASANKAQPLELARLRFQLTKMRFQRGAVAQDRLLQEYQHKTQALIKSIRDLRAEDAKLDSMQKHEKEGEEEQRLQSEKILKVRTLWADVNNILSALEDERQVVDCVVKGNTDQYTLDGTDLTIEIPEVLQDQIERSGYLSSAGSVYEDGKLNVLRLLELLKEALRLLREEREQVRGSALQPDLQRMEEEARLLRCTLETIKVMRKKISKEDIPEAKAFVRKMELEWDRKWVDLLKRKPLTSFLNKEDPALEFLSPMAPLCFEPATEGSFKSSVVSQYPAKLSALCGTPGSPHAVELKEEAPVEIFSSSRSADERNEDVEDPLSVCLPASHSNEAPAPSHVVSSKQTSCKAPLSKSVKASNGKNLPVRVALPKATAMTKAMIMERECDNLAEQFAEAVATSPDCGNQGMELEALLGTLLDPFSTRKQIPRTPESLISEVKNSWRRAVEEGEAEKAQLSARQRDGTPNAMKIGSFADAPRPQEMSGASLFDPLHDQARDSLQSTLSWDSAQLEAMQLQGQSTSDVIQFGIASETIPELLGCESMLSSSDGVPDISGLSEEGENELVLPKILSHATDAVVELRSRLNRIRKDYGEESFTCCREKTPEPPSPVDPRNFPEALEWETSGKVFSLDLDSLESPSISKREELSLPKLVTTSPIDDLVP
ncbi:hypothetical protein GJAV_G00162040 [Gymnothorax javanicus]|nr:hypothetical protein GJAV_G00162040 [Gymnothorax javanicus]